jgi:hypothetical protein
MGLVTNIIAAEEDEAEAVAMSDRPVEEWTGIEARDIDAVKLATLHCLLNDDSFEEALYAYEPILVLDDEGVLVLRIPDDVTEKLTRLDEEGLERVGEELAATEVFELTGWPVEEVQALVVELSDVARVAESQGHVMLAWMRAVNT